MPTRNEQPHVAQAAISVSEMARRLALSRGRMYELIRQGVFPGPCYCPYTRRALYPADLQQQCVLVRETNVGINGQYILFYRPRNAAPATSLAPARRHGRNTPSANAGNGLVHQLREGLTALGLSAISDPQIQAALNVAFPAGTNGIDHGTVLAAVFRAIRRPIGA